MWLSHLHVINLRNLVDVDIPLSGGAVIVSENRSGKSKPPARYPPCAGPFAVQCTARADVRRLRGVPLARALDVELSALVERATPVLETEDGEAAGLVAFRTP